jgi:hypothetical protein
MEAAQRQRNVQQSFRIKPFSHAPSEVLIHKYSSTASSESNFTELQSNLAQVEVRDLSPTFQAHSSSAQTSDTRNVTKEFNENATQTIDSSEKKLQRQAYVAMKASPNVSAYGDISCGEDYSAQILTVHFLQVLACAYDENSLNIILLNFANVLKSEQQVSTNVE